MSNFVKETFVTDNGLEEISSKNLGLPSLPKEVGTIDFYFSTGEKRRYLTTNNIFRRHKYYVLDDNFNFREFTSSGSPNSFSKEFKKSSKLIYRSVDPARIVCRRARDGKLFTWLYGSSGMKETTQEELHAMQGRKINQDGTMQACDNV